MGISFLYAMVMVYDASRSGQSRALVGKWGSHRAKDEGTERSIHEQRKTGTSDADGMAWLGTHWLINCSSNRLAPQSSHPTEVDELTRLALPASTQHPTLHPTLEGKWGGMMEHAELRHLLS